MPPQALTTKAGGGAPDNTGRALPANSVTTAIVLMFAASACFSALDTSAKVLTTFDRLPVAEVIWVRFLSHTILNAAFLGPASARTALRTAKPLQQMLRGFFMLGATGFNFAALQYLQLDQAVTISFLAPFLVAALGGPMLGERIGKQQTFAIGAGFCGVILVTRPGLGGMHWAVAFSLASTLSYAFYLVWTRLLARFDPSRTTQMLSPLVGLVAVAPFALASWQWPHSLQAALLLMFLGVPGGLGHWLVILAHAKAPAPVLAPYTYLGILFMIAAGFVVFGDEPSWWTIAGAAVIVASGLYLFFRERHASKLASASEAALLEG